MSNKSSKGSEPKLIKHGANIPKLQPVSGKGAPIPTMQPASQKPTGSDGSSQSSQGDQAGKGNK